MVSLPVESLLAVAAGIGLAAATGFRVFLPFLLAGLAARWGSLPLSEGFQWLASTGTLAALAIASVLEVAAYYIPGLDHVLDALSAPAALIAGVIASAAVMVDIPPGIMWPVALIGGGGMAGLTKVTSALVRGKTGLATAGLANPVVSTGETVGATGVALLAIVVPLLCLLGVIMLILWSGPRIWRLVVSRAERRRADRAHEARRAWHRPRHGNGALRQAGRRRRRHARRRVEADRRRIACAAREGAFVRIESGGRALRYARAPWPGSRSPRRIT